MPKTSRLIAVALAIAFVGGWTAAAHAAFVSKETAREYLLNAVPKGAPRVMLRDERAAFFRTARLSLQSARQCQRRSADAVSCAFRARLVPDAAHRARNWWPIACRGSVVVRRHDDGRLQGHQGAYVCRTVRPPS
ncbi:MAG TPA: hypothetical protein VGO80_14315 [Solirubrobacteraceae bacterium]|jgi:hypothetical protein|nr:hypothetical protein [Solirubrobacteraceae bacterium]